MSDGGTFRVRVDWSPSFDVAPDSVETPPGQPAPSTTIYGGSDRIRLVLAPLGACPDEVDGHASCMDRRDIVTVNLSLTESERGYALLEGAVPTGMDAGDIGYARIEALYDSTGGPTTRFDYGQWSYGAFTSPIWFEVG